MKNSVKIERQWMKILQGVPAEERAVILYNITEYLFCGEISDKKEYAAQTIILNMIAAENAHKQRVSAKRKEAGMKGAQKRWGKEQAKAVKTAKVAKTAKPVVQAEPQGSCQTLFDNSNARESKPEDIINNKTIETLQSSSIWLEQLAMKFKITIEEIKGYITEFALDSNCRGATHNSERELKNHLVNWLQIRLKIKKQENGNIQQGHNDKRRGTEITATSWEDYEGAF